MINLLKSFFESRRLNFVTITSFLATCSIFTLFLLPATLSSLKIYNVSENYVGVFIFCMYLLIFVTTSFIAYIQNK